MSQEYIYEIHNLLINDKIVVFVGAGVSKNSNYPTWDEYTEKVAKELNIEKTPRFSFEEHTQFAQYLFNKDQNKYYELLSETFDVTVESSDLHKKIVDLNQSTIVTTNYDNLLENSKAYGKYQYDVVYNDEKLLGTSGKSKQIIKIHGDINDLESIVLKEDDYLTFKENKKAIHTYLNHLFFTKSILFIGYSLSDYNVKQILSDIHKYQQTLPEQSDKRKHYLLHYKSDNDENYEYNKELLRNNNVIIIETNSYKDGVKSTLANDVGKSIYGFIDYVMNVSLPKSENFQDIINQRFKKLNQREFISTDEVLSVLEELPLNESTDRVLKLKNKKIFDYIKREIGKDNSVIRKTFMKTLLEYVTLENESELFELLLVDEFENRKNHYSNLLLEKKKKNVFFDSIRESILRNDVTIQDFSRNEKIGKNNFEYLRDQINEIIIEHPNNNHMKLFDKYDLIKSSFNGEDKIVNDYLWKVIKYQFDKNDIYKKTEMISSETKRRNGFFVTNTDVFGELNRSAQMIHLYPILNNVLSYWYNSDYNIVGKYYTDAYLSLFDEGFLHSEIESQFKNSTLSLLDVIMMSDIVNLEKILKNKNIKRIKVDFEIQILINFLNDYSEILFNMSIVNNRISYLNNKFMKNILIFIGLIQGDSDEVCQSIENVFSKEDRMFADYLMYFFSLPFVEGKLSGFNYNESVKIMLEYDVYFNKYKVLIYKYRQKLTSDLQMNLLEKFTQEIKETDNFPEWVFYFANEIYLKDCIEMSKLNKYNLMTLVNLINIDILDLGSQTVQVLKNKIMIQDLKVKGITFGYSNTDYDTLLSLYRKTNNARELWELFVLVEERKYISNIIRSGSLGTLNYEMSEKEARIILLFLREDIYMEKINCEKIEKELINLMKHGLDSVGSRMLWGAIQILK